MGGDLKRIIFQKKYSFFSLFRPVGIFISGAALVFGGFALPEILQGYLEEEPRDSRFLSRNFTASGVLPYAPSL
jgi:hypothetical protein